jgi:hypothetical protein
VAAGPKWWERHDIAVITIAVVLGLQPLIWFGPDESIGVRLGFGAFVAVALPLLLLARRPPPET